MGPQAVEDILDALHREQNMPDARRVRRSAQVAARPGGVWYLISSNRPWPKLGLVVGHGYLQADDGELEGTDARHGSCGLSRGARARP